MRMPDDARAATRAYTVRLYVEGRALYDACIANGNDLVAERVTETMRALYRIIERLDDPRPIGRWSLFLLRWRLARTIQRPR